VVDAVGGNEPQIRILSSKRDRPALCRGPPVSVVTPVKILESTSFTYKTTGRFEVGRFGKFEQASPLNRVCQLQAHSSVSMCCQMCTHPLRMCFYFVNKIQIILNATFLHEADGEMLTWRHESVVM
jgi:hypothetical protein